MDDFDKLIMPVMEKVYSSLYGFLNMKYQNSIWSKLLIDPNRVEVLKSDFLASWE